MLNRQHLPILHAARAILDADVHEYICFALSRAVYGDPALEELADDVHAVIQEGLRDARGSHWATLGAWVIESVFPGLQYASRAPEPYSSGYIHDSGVMHLARLAWLDKLIFDLENT